MPETVLKAPNYFDREFDLTERTIPVGGVPATIIGGADKGPAFVPISLGSYTDFQNRFGPLDPHLVGAYALQKFFESKGSELASCNYIRVLGCGANTTPTDISDTESYGIVSNAGMKISGSGSPVTNVLSGALSGRVQFLVGQHSLPTNEAFGYPMFSENTSYPAASSDTVNLVRAVLFTTPDARFLVASGSTGVTYNPALVIAGTNNFEAAQAGVDGAMQGQFKLILSSSVSTFAKDDNLFGIRIYSASLDPSSNQYIGKILNTNPENFEERKHVLYLHYPVDAEVAALATSNTAPTVAVLSGSSNVAAGAYTFGDVFGMYNTRYAAPKTPYFISQPFGDIEYDLFYVESLDDGDYANNKYKFSILNLAAPTNPSTKYGTFTLQVRAFGDSDIEAQVLESFNNLSLDPDSSNYIVKVIGDKKTRFDFDQLNEIDRGLAISGKYGVRSKYIRVIPSSQMDAGEVPEKALPFGFRGHQMLLTNTALRDQVNLTALNQTRITGVSASATGGGALLSGSLVPPVPFRFTVTRNNLATSGAPGNPGDQTTTDARLFWGVKFERNDNEVLNVNVNASINPIIENFAKFSGIEKLGVLTTGSASDTLNLNKFTLAKVALSNQIVGSITGDLTSSVALHMREAAYLRDATLNPVTYVASNYGNRMTFATLLNVGDSITFNNFSRFAKFTTFMQGGWNGTNIFDKEASRFTDRSTSNKVAGASTYGLAASGYVSPGSNGVNYTGVDAANSNVIAYRTAVEIATNPSIANNNILAIPGQRDPLVTDYALEKNLAFGLSFYLMDIEPFDQNGVSSGRIFDGETGRYSSIIQTSNAFISRAVDNNAAAAYFPSVVIDDTVNTRRVTVPASVAAVSALSYTDRVKFPWFAPAGFDRGSLSFVRLTSIRVNQTDRNTLYDANINPIVKFPGENYVFFSQNTLQQATSALESINVKRMILEIKRQIVEIGNRILFEQNTPALRTRFISEASVVLASVQLRQGIEKFLVICDNRNNSSEDVNTNRMNAQIRVLPTRAIEYIEMDFVILPSGTSLI